MNMKNKWIALFLAVAMIFSCFGCAFASETESELMEEETLLEDSSGTVPEDWMAEDAAQMEMVVDQLITVEDYAVTEGLPDEWVNILLLGTDVRDTKNYGRTDSMIVLSVNLATKEAKLTSFMRDLWVSMHGRSSKGKLNSACVYGGPQLTMRTINETFGLKWDHVDLEAGTILIDRQMQYQEGLIKLIGPKTINSKRTIIMCELLKRHLQEKKNKRDEDEVRLADLRKQNRRQIEDLDGNFIFSTEFVNCLPDGRLQTVNSMKYPTREIKQKLGIEFKYHYLRHTYGTMMAEMNTPTHLLCNQMGHGTIRVTQRYYIAISKTGMDILRNNLNHL